MPRSWSLPGGPPSNSMRRDAREMLLSCRLKQMFLITPDVKGDRGLHPTCGCRLDLLLFIVFSAFPLSAFANPPPGFEVVEVASGSKSHGAPRMNNCGEFVFYIGKFPNGDIHLHLYDNGLITTLPEAPPPSGFGDINDYGDIAWEKEEPDGTRVVCMICDGQFECLGEGGFPRINNSCHLAWDLFDPITCASESNIFYYNSKEIFQITSDGLSNQGPEINDLDQITWTRFDFCPEPEIADIMFYQDGLTTVLTGDQPFAQIPSINNLGQVAWSDLSIGIELWEDGETTVIAPPASINPRLNNHGDVYFLRWHAFAGVWQSWIMLDGAYYRITNDTDWNTDGDINDYGECAWRWSNWPEFDTHGVRYMRRIRNGDVDFDGDSDLADYSAMPACMTGPGDFDRLCDCRFLDMGHDRDVDLADFALFQNSLTPPP